MKQSNRFFCSNGSKKLKEIFKRLVYIICFAFLLTNCHIPFKKHKPSILWKYTSFPGGITALDSFISSVRSNGIYLPDSLNDADDSFFNQEITIRIDTFGNITDTGYTLWAGFNIIQADVENIIGKMPKWEPASINDLKTNKRKKIDDLFVVRIKYFYYSKRPNQ